MSTNQQQARIGSDISRMLPPAGSLIDGKWVTSDRTFTLLDKYLLQPITDIFESQPDHVGHAIRVAGKAVARGAPPPVDRAEYFRRAVSLLEERRALFAPVMVAETGFTGAEVNGDIDRTLVTLSLCAEEATRVLGETVPFASTPGQHHRIGFTLRVPVGIVCCITPFNSPLNTVAHKVAPALAAGNSVILKPSELTPLTAALFSQLLLDAGVPADFVTLLQGSGSAVGRQLVADPAIAFYSFTGSTRVGREIQQGAGLRRTQMELGSIASTIVCRDARLDAAVPKILAASFRKAGQVCTSTQRLYVERPLYQETIDRLGAQASTLRIGDPRDPKTRIGPMISVRSAERAARWIDEAKQGQARVIAGGVRTNALLTPTILTEVRDGMRVIDEEIFAPCVSVIPFDTLAEAISHANNTPFGLAAGIFTEDIGCAIQAARGMRFGAVHINEASSARSDAMPFGGVKDSGFGREGPAYAIRELTEERVVTFNGYAA